MAQSNRFVRGFGVLSCKENFVSSQKGLVYVSVTMLYQGYVFSTTACKNASPTVGTTYVGIPTY